VDCSDNTTDADVGVEEAAQETEPSEQAALPNTISVFLASGTIAPGTASWGAPPSAQPSDDVGTAGDACEGHVSDSSGAAGAEAATRMLPRAESFEGNTLKSTEGDARGEMSNESAGGDGATTDPAASAKASPEVSTHNLRCTSRCLVVSITSA
jgi:hypothetical protein